MFPLKHARDLPSVSPLLAAVPSLMLCCILPEPCSASGLGQLVRWLYSQTTPQTLVEYLPQTWLGCLLTQHNFLSV